MACMCKAGPFVLCHVTIILKWLPNMGMLSSASSFCICEKMLRCHKSRSYVVVIKVDIQRTTVITSASFEKSRLKEISYQIKKKNQKS